MKVTVNQQELINTLELLTRVSTKHVTLPVLQCVHIKTFDTKIVCTTTNLEISIESPVTATVIEAGVVAVYAQTLLQSIQYNTQKDITLTAVDGVLKIESGRSVTKINTMVADDFPIITHLETTGVMVKRQTFSLGIKTVAFAASVSSIKPELGSVFIQQKKEHSLTFVATDSFRLMEKTVPQQGVVLSQSLLVPQKNAIELARVCEVLTEDPELLVTDNQCALRFPNGVYVISRLVAGTFPDYEAIIPKEYTTHVTVLKQDLVQCFKKTQIFLNKFMQVTLGVSDGSLLVSSQNGELGTTEDVVRVDTEGSPLTLNFNQQYVLDPLSHITDDSIVLHFAGIGRPLVLGGVADISLRYLVMPMNR